MSNTLEELKLAIVDGDDEIAVENAIAALDEGLQPVEIMEQAVVAGIEKAGRLWSENKYFLPDVILSAGAFKAATDVIKPKLANSNGPSQGRIMIGVVEGDMHDLGQTIVMAMLAGAGFEVIDLGVDVPLQTFVDKVKQFKPDILGLGAYMTTTMLLMKDIIDKLEEEGLKNDLKIMVGGVPTTQKFADEIGADAWGKDALDTITKARSLVPVLEGA
ncbi:MAG: corrinoid protein [Anaerolineales bacterium]|nr:corrinoid protein [Anaerolineales bacterium]